MAPHSSDLDLNIAVIALVRLFGRAHYNPLHKQPARPCHAAATPALAAVTGVDHERIVNRIKSKVRSRVEHVFAVVIKGQFGFTKLRYRGLAKNATRAFVALGLANIYLARGRLAA